MLLIGRGGAPKAPGPFACRIRRRAIFLEAPVVGGNRQPPGQESGARDDSQAVGVVRWADKMQRRQRPSEHRERLRHVWQIDRHDGVIANTFASSHRGDTRFAKNFERLSSALIG
jgi:hypothetical protein